MSEPERVGSAAPHHVGLSPPGDGDEMRAIVQERLALLAGIMFWVFWILFALVAGLYEIWPETRPERVGVFFYCCVAALVIATIVWFAVLRRSRPSTRLLYVIDILYLFLAGSCFGVSAYFQSDLEVAVYAALISHLIMVFGRAIIVPSSRNRTLVVSSLSFVPLLTGGLAVVVVMPERIGLPPAAFAIAALFYSTVAVVVAAKGSEVIYGLRRRVQQLGHYTLIKELEGGGMGEVYLARHALLKRLTAIKRVRPDKVGAESLRRFEREVQTTSRLTHPNTVAIYDYGRSLDGVFYCAMEYVDGINLEHLVHRDGPQPASRVIHILRQVSGALDEAHGIGVIHRDIKPANVLLCRRGSQPDIAKVVDFGLVKELAGPTEEHSSHVILGTPLYMSPEAITDPDLVGPRSDLYSLGATAYFLLTGAHVFDGKTGVEVCMHHVGTPPPPPSARTDNPIPPDLEALVMACLSKDPAQRPQSAFDLGVALARLQARHGWDEDAARTWWRDHDRARASEVRTTESTAPMQLPHTLTIDIDRRSGPGGLVP